MAATQHPIEIEEKPNLEIHHGEHISKWSEIKVEAERAEDYQRGLSLLPSLKIYRAVSQAPLADTDERADRICRLFSGRS